MIVINQQAARLAFEEGEAVLPSELGLERSRVPLWLLRRTGEIGKELRANWPRRLCSDGPPPGGLLTAKEATPHNHFPRRHLCGSTREAKEKRLTCNDFLGFVLDIFRVAFV